LEVFAAVPARLAADAAYQAASAQFMALPKSQRGAYERIETSLNVAFDSMKKLVPPRRRRTRRRAFSRCATYQSPLKARA